MRLQLIEITTAEQIPCAFDTALTGEAEGLIVINGAMFWNERAQIVALAARSRLPAIYPEREYADDGGVLADGPIFRIISAVLRHTSDKIFKGAKPADLPIEQPTKFEFIINLKAGQARLVGMCRPRCSSAPTK